MAHERISDEIVAGKFEATRYNLRMPPERHEEEGIERLRRAMYSRKYGQEMGPRPRHEFDTEEPHIAEDWEHKDPKPDYQPLPGVLRPKRSRMFPLLKWALGISILFFVGAVAFFVYYLYYGGASGVSARNIEINITGPAEIAGGEPVSLQVTVTNRNRDALLSAELIASFPVGTRLDPSSCSESSCRVALGTIASGASAAIKLPAIYQGTVGQHDNVRIEIEYTLGGSNATFSASSEYGFVFSSAPLSIAVEGNSQTISGQLMQIKLTVSSNASQPIPGVLLSTSAPFGFKLLSAEPAPRDSNLWALGTLSPGERKTITLNGTLRGETGENKVFHFTAGTNTSATSSAISATLGSVDLPVMIAEPFLSLALSINDASSTKSVVVTPGQLVTVSVQYKNNLQTAITNAVIVAKLSGLPIDGTAVQSNDGFYRSTDSAVLWDKTTTRGDLANVVAEQAGRLSFSFTVPTTEQLVGVQNPALVISVNASGQRLSESGVPENLQSTVSQKIAVSSDLALTAKGLYFSNPFGVSGNMPPKAEVETRYAVVFTVTNTTNAISGGKVTATLPPYVRLVGNHYLPATEKVNFNGTTGTFTWDVGDIAANTGLNGTAPRQVVIELGLTPSTSQIGSEPIILQDIKLTGTDVLTDQPISKKANCSNDACGGIITTNIVGDPGFSSVNAKVVR